MNGKNNSNLSEPMIDQMLTREHVINLIETREPVIYTIGKREQFCLFLCLHFDYVR
jgi:hypothetical protein